MENEYAQKLAEKIANLISAESVTIDLTSLQKTVDGIEKRLAVLETSISNPRFEISNLHSRHPSQDHFSIAEAIVESLFEKSTKEKACAFEPNGKPCDHCSMCNSRGF